MKFAGILWVGLGCLLSALGEGTNELASDPEQEAAGAFKIMDPPCAASFWNYFTNDSLHTFYSKEEG